MNMDQNETLERPSKLWMSVIFCICAGIIIYGVWGGRSSSGVIAYELGENLPIAILIGGLLHWCFKSKESTRTSWLGFALIYAALSIASISATNRYHEQKKILTNDLRTTFDSIKTAIDKGEIPNKIPEFKSKGDSEPARMGAVLQRIFYRTTEHRKQYESEFNALKWDTILDPMRLGGDKDFSESFSIISKAKTIISRYQATTDSLFLAMRSEIEGADLDAQAKRGMLAGFDKSEPQGKADANQLWSIEMEIVNTVETMLADLRRNRSAWTVKDKQIIFTSQSSLDSYRANLDLINRLSKKQDMLRQNSLKRSSDKLNQLD